MSAVVPGVHQEVPGQPEYCQPIRDVDVKSDYTLILLCFADSLFPGVSGVWGRSLLDLCVVNRWSSGVEPLSPPTGIFVHIQQEVQPVGWVGSSVAGPTSQFKYRCLLVFGA